MAALLRTGRLRIVMDIRPMVWQATVIAPAADADVTIVMRVTYLSLEQICSEDDDGVAYLPDPVVALN